MKLNEFEKKRLVEELVTYEKLKEQNIKNLFKEAYKTLKEERKHKKQFDQDEEL